MTLFSQCSSISQDLAAQLQALEKEGTEKIYSEKFTGTKSDRPQFQKLLSLLQVGATLVITKLDRFARSTVDALKTKKSLFEKGVKVHILNMGLVENTPTGKLRMSAFAEFERDMIVERTQEGKAIVKLREDFREGRPKKFSKIQIEHALQLLESNSYKQVENMTGISNSTFIRIKRK